MLFFMVFLIFCNVTLATNKNAGSVIFKRAKLNRNCWHKDDIAKLEARRAFEELLPPTVTPEQVNTQYVKDTIQYYKNALLTAERDVDPYTAEILKEALYDTIGAQLRTETLPSVRFAYYAGYIPYRSARQFHKFYEDIKTYLNTQGEGWKQPAQIPEWSNLTVTKIAIGFGKFLDPCASLVTKRDANNCLHLPTPRLDDERVPSAIALPFKKKGLASLKTPSSENILLKYYTTAARCILHSSPANCRHLDFISFNNQLWHWLKRDVAPHLIEEQLFAAYGGVLRIGAAVQTYGRGLSRRNLFENGDNSLEGARLNPWRTFTQSYIYVNADWTPVLYIALVILIAIVIYVLQLGYSYVFGEVPVCKCKSTLGKPSTKDIAYATVDSNFPAVLPQHVAVCDVEQNRGNAHKSKPPSVKSTKEHTVYDLNENREKVMALSISDHDSDEVSTSESDTREESEKQKTAVSIGEPGLKSSPKSPPRLEVAQSTIKKPRSLRPVVRDSRSKYSTSTMTQSGSNMTFCREHKCRERHDSDWTDSSSASSSGKYLSSATSSKSRSVRSKKARDLAWARRVMTRQARRSTQSSCTEIGTTSVLTPPPKR